MVSRLVKPAVASTPLSLQGRKGGPNMGTVLDCWEQTETAQTPGVVDGAHPTMGWESEKVDRIL